jgi:hypothetical protein
MRYSVSAVICLICLPRIASAQSGLTFERDVRPILKQHCFQCHGEEPEKQGALDLRTVKLILKGGESGPEVVAGAPDGSRLWQRVASDEMPEGPKKVPEAQKLVLKAWIEQGAKTARTEPDNPDDVKFTEEELSHWAFQPVKPPRTPRVREECGARTPIDGFLLAKLSEQGIAAFSPEADRRTQIRRVTFDLLGRPPVPEETSQFLRDDSADAYERLVDRLLASPEYGERWARHWLDIAGYAETAGGTGPETERPHAWRYRDYVIHSLNSDKPYDQFLQEQLAGDELVERPFDMASPRTVELLAATGFLRMAPDITQASNTLMDRNQAVADVIKVTSSALLGLTVGCAQCHDHKYDPIANEDYYRLRAIFDPAFNVQRWLQPEQRQLDITTKADIEAAEAIEKQAVEQDKLLRDEMTAGAKVVQDRAVGRLPEPDREPTRAAAETKESERTQEQKDLLLKYPEVKSIDFVRGFFVEYDKDLHAKYTKRQQEITALRATKPARQFVMAAFEPQAPPPESKLYFRGDPEQPKQTVSPGELAALCQQSEFEPPTQPADAFTTGRRLAYARWLTSGMHPLTARVIVNRMWLHHFGRGIVATPGDFGLNGERPSHPELLDWLASEFVRQRWSLKAMQRLIVTSAAYRQTSTRTDELDRIDPDNRLLGRMSLRRLEAEAVRDSLLAVSGTLTKEIGGPSVPITEDGEGKAVFGTRKTSEGLFAGVAGIGRDEFRRSIYIQSRRALPLIMLETFDLPAMTPNCEIRRSSTVATQSLMFLNDETIWRLAEAMAQRLDGEAESSQARVYQALVLLFNQDATAEEVAECMAFVEAQTRAFREVPDPAWQEKLRQSPEAAELRAMASLCQTLMCSNRFLYVD